MTPFQNLITRQYSPVPVIMLFAKHRQFDFTAKDNKRKILRYIPFYQSNALVHSHFLLISKIQQ